MNIMQTTEETQYLKNNVLERGFRYCASPKFFVRAGAASADGLYDIACFRNLRSLQYR